MPEETFTVQRWATNIGEDMPLKPPFWMDMGLWPTLSQAENHALALKDMGAIARIKPAESVYPDTTPPEELNAIAA